MEHDRPAQPTCRPARGPEGAARTAAGHAPGRAGVGPPGADRAARPVATHAAGACAATGVGGRTGPRGQQHHRRVPGRGRARPGPAVHPPHRCGAPPRGAALHLRGRRGRCSGTGRTPRHEGTGAGARPGAPRRCAAGAGDSPPLRRAGDRELPAGGAVAAAPGPAAPGRTDPRRPVLHRPRRVRRMVDVDPRPGDRRAAQPAPQRRHAATGAGHPVR